MAQEREDWSDLDTTIADGLGRRIDRLEAAQAARLRRLITEMYGE